jgi:hypothetical protein
MSRYLTTTLRQVQSIFSGIEKFLDIQLGETERFPALNPTMHTFCERQRAVQF